MRRIADANGDLLKDYVHNALGQRLFKTEPQFPPAAGDEVDPVFIASLLAEVGTGGAQSTGTSLYFYLPTPSGPMPIAAITNGTGYAVHTDHLNTPRRLTLANKTVAWQWAFSAFGDAQPTAAKNRFVDLTTSASLGSTNIADVAFNLRYPGQYFDKESGLSYNYFRSYDSRTGRYTQSDPIGLQGGWDRYAYVSGNPLSYVDPRGLKLTCIIPFGCIYTPDTPPLYPDIPPYAQPGNPGGNNGGPMARPDPISSRANGEPTLPIVNPGRDCDGNCNPCPPGKTWRVNKPGHGWPNWYDHRIDYNQNKQSCICYPDRPSTGLVGG